MDRDEKEWWIFIIICVTFFVCAIFFTFCDQQSERKKFLKTWNYGYHITDNGKWVMSEAVGHERHTTYIYKCNKCGAWIELGAKELYWIKKGK